MALINCPECGRERVSDSAVACPECGYGIKEHFEKQKRLEAEAEKERLRRAEAEKLRREKEARAEERLRIEEEKRKQEVLIQENSNLIEEDKSKKNTSSFVAAIVIIIAIVVGVLIFNSDSSNQSAQSNQPSQPKYQQQIEKASTSYINGGDYTNIIEELKKTTELTEEEIKKLFIEEIILYVQKFYNEEKYEEAYKFLKNVKKDFGENSDLNYNINYSKAMDVYSRGQYEAAVTRFESFNYQGEEYWESCYQQALSYLEWGDSWGRGFAVECLEKIVDYNYKDSVSLLAKLKGESGNPTSSSSSNKTTSASSEHNNLTYRTVTDKDTLIEVWSMAQLFVEDKLKSPKSADFPYYGDSNVSIESAGNSYKVIGYVDAKNSFNAEIRTPFILIMEKSGSNYKLKECIFLE